MEVLTGEKYLISKAKKSQFIDPCASKAWIITAKTLYPNDFSVQFEAYLLEKKVGNYEEAAKCFSYIVMTFKNQQTELWNEISQLTAALRVPEGGATTEQEFYVKMFQHITYDVQHKILLLTANHSDNNLDHCRLILLLLKRFPQAISTHSPRLLETIIQGMSIAPVQFREMLVLEVIPLIIQRPPEIGNQIVNRMMTISFEYYVNQMFEDTEDRKALINSSWKKIFEILELCGKMLKWEPFLQYNKTLNKDVYWQKLIQIVSSAPPRPSENKQILFCATILFILSLQEYILNTKTKVNGIEVDLIMVEGFKDTVPESSKRRKQDTTVIDAPQISVNYPCTPEIASCFVTAINCWQLLHSNEILKMDFTQIIRSLPLSQWINRILLDFSVYWGRNDENAALIKDSISMSLLEKNVRSLSLIVGQGNFSPQSFDVISTCLAELPQATGTVLQNLSIQTVGKHFVLIPLTKKAILQYITKIIINSMKSKLLSNPNSDDTLLGNLLVLLQLDWPNELALAETIFAIIKAKGSFSYLLFPKYIINIDFIEEFMSMWYPHGGSIQLEFITPQPTVGQRRIGTRGADKGVKEDFKQIIKKQISKTSEDIDALIIQFITQERAKLAQNIFDK